MINVIAALAGAVFAAGVCISGMVRPSKVLGFLDFGGAWDATLLVVMATALSLHAVAWRVVKARRSPPFGAGYPAMPAQVIDWRLLGGAALFGLGWGLSGYCPGPAIVSVVSGARASFVFVGAMAAAMLVVSRVTESDG